MNGVDVRKSAIGARYLRVHYSADPGKNDAWVAAEKAKTPIKEWLREMEMREDIYDGEPVYGDYVDKWHCMMQDLPITPHHGSIYFGGWDCGQTLVPAFTLLEVTPRPWQVRALLEVISPGAEPMQKFAPRVLAALQKRLPGNWDEVEHWADATVRTQNGSNGETAQQAAKKFGVRLRPASNEWIGRYGAVTWLLMDSIDVQGPNGDVVVPRFVVDGYHCPTLREGFQGAYKLDDSPAGEAVGPGRILKEKPLKNSYSHVHDSLQYAAARVKKLFRGGRFQFEREP